MTPIYRSHSARLVAAHHEFIKLKVFHSGPFNKEVCVMKMKQLLKVTCCHWSYVFPLFCSCFFVRIESNKSHAVCRAFILPHPSTHFSGYKDPWALFSYVNFPSAHVFCKNDLMKFLQKHKCSCLKQCIRCRWVSSRVTIQRQRWSCWD